MIILSIIHELTGVAEACSVQSRKSIMFTTTVRYLGTKPKPATKALEPRFRPEQNQTITRAIFEILKEHGPLSVAQTWERVQVT